MASPRNLDGNLQRQDCRLYAPATKQQQQSLHIVVVVVVVVVVVAVVVVVEVLLYVHRNRTLIRDGSPGRPPRVSHSS